MEIKISFRQNLTEADEDVMELYLFRHGYTRFNLEHRYQGRTDLPIVESESCRIVPFSLRTVPHKAVPYYKKFPDDVVYVSPAFRARQTADLLFPGMKQMIVPEFAEMDFGIFEGRKADEMEDDPQYRSWVDSMCLDPIPLGESYEVFMNRVSIRFQKLAADAFDEGCRRLLIVAHGGTQMAVMDRFCEEKRDYWSWKSEPAEGICAMILRR